MSDDFVRLVSQANPASRNQYQPANTGYPPSSSPPQALDPFFDDDDDVLQVLVKVALICLSLCAVVSVAAYGVMAVYRGCVGYED